MLGYVCFEENLKGTNLWTTKLHCFVGFFFLHFLLCSSDGQVSRMSLFDENNCDVHSSNLLKQVINSLLECSFKFEPSTHLTEETGASSPLTFFLHRRCTMMKKFIQL